LLTPEITFRDKNLPFKMMKFISIRLDRTSPCHHEKKKEAEEMKLLIT